MPKDKEGNKLTWKEYMARWKSGIEAMTPEQANKIQFRGTIITMIGIVCGIGISLTAYNDLWWLGLILIGALFNTWVQFVGQNAQRKQFKKLQGEAIDISDITNILDQMKSEEEIEQLTKMEVKK